MEMSFRMIKARIEEARDPKDRRRVNRHPVEIGARVRELGVEGFEASRGQRIGNRERQHSAAGDQADRRGNTRNTISHD